MSSIFMHDFASLLSCLYVNEILYVLQANHMVANKIKQTFSFPSPPDNQVLWVLLVFICHMNNLVLVIGVVILCD